MPTSVKITTLRRQESSRANGAKSHGPIMPESTPPSSRNALLAAAITITEEEQAAFEELRTQYEIEFAPRNRVQSDIVTQIAWSTLRLQLAWAEESSLIELEMDSACQRWTGLTPTDRRALSVQSSLKGSHALSVVQRYIRSLSTQIERSIKLLLLLQKQPLPAPPEPEVPAAPEPKSENCKNEPIPINEHREPPTATEPENCKNEPIPINEQPPDL